MLFKGSADRVTLGAQAIVADRSGRVLLVRHGYRPGWHFPGGGVERSESLHTAVVREVEEETGIVLSEPPRLFGIYSHFDAFPGDHIVLYLAQTWQRARVPAPNREIAEQGFFALYELPEDTTLPTRRRLAEVFLHEKKSDAW